jgi:hypothetical protein
MLTPCGHRNENNSIVHAAKEKKQNCKHCKQLRNLFANRKTIEKNARSNIAQGPL